MPENSSDVNTSEAPGRQTVFGPLLPARSFRCLEPSLGWGLVSLPRSISRIKCLTSKTQNSGKAKHERKTEKNDEAKTAADSVTRLLKVLWAFLVNDCFHWRAWRLRQLPGGSCRAVLVFQLLYVLACDQDCAWRYRTTRICWRKTASGRKLVSSGSTPSKRSYTTRGVITVPHTWPTPTRAHLLTGRSPWHRTAVPQRTLATTACSSARGSSWLTEPSSARSH